MIVHFQPPVLVVDLSVFQIGRVAGPLKPGLEIVIEVVEPVHLKLCAGWARIRNVILSCVIVIGNCVKVDDAIVSRKIIRDSRLAVSGVPTLVAVGISRRRIHFKHDWKVVPERIGAKDAEELIHAHGYCSCTQRPVAAQAVVVEAEVVVTTKIVHIQPVVFI